MKDNHAITIGSGSLTLSTPSAAASEDGCALIYSSGGVIFSASAVATEAYVDAAVGAISLDWSAIQNKPATFPPSAHTHDDRYYTESEIDSALAAKASDSAVLHTTGNESATGVKTFSGTLRPGIIQPIGSGLVEFKNIYGGTIASLGVGNGTNLFMASGAESGWSDAKATRNATGPTYQIQAAGGLAVKNLAGNAGARASIGDLNSLDGDLLIYRSGIAIARLGASLSTFCGSIGIAAYPNPSSPDVYISRDETGPKLQIQANGGLAVKSLNGVADANFTAGVGTFSGGLVVTGATTIGPKTFATLPSASANPGAVFRLTDRNQKIVQSDATDWRFLHDNSIAS